ncbi:hypothetical protein BEL04_03440 [Mucilaginibacter sp. PPCGB 2223]|uniref:hypothetical protein n=1 Tax=Mucilaginibacter sp. PPCGB 2223 TaxID=1886027 RepID=UPI000825D1AC|nr:hypothetical protein [Mucilaginibacter sp. PPCGB 2223]OCX53367.1 hypothetical protein BEL04_03440 [Mucilaginibacter sp. PPCGB 2223]
MKKINLIVISVMVFGAVSAYAQTTNTFPATGNAGIGTTTPAADLVIQNTAPELRFITTADLNNFARFLRSTASSNNLFQGKNHVLQVGSTSNAIRFTATNQSFSSTDAGMPSGSSITMTFSCVYKGANSNYNFLAWGSSTQYITIFAVATTYYVYYGGTRIFFGTLPNDSNWHNLIFVMNGASGSLYIDNTLNKTMTFEASYNVALGGPGSFHNGTAVTTPVDIDQVLIYNRALSRTSGSGSTDEIAQIYNSGSYTASPPASGLIRRYEFEEGTGSSVADLNPNTTTYNLALNNSPTWLINGSVVPLGGSGSESTFFSVSDGLINNERGIATWGDFNGRNQQQGKWFQWFQGSNYPLVSDNSGHWLFNPNNTSATLPTVASTVDVAGNLTIGSAYAGTNAAPANGLIVQGNVGIGTPTPAYPFQINEPLTGQGTISVTAGSGTVTGVGTNFISDFNIGDVIKANTETHIITAIASVTNMTTDNWISAYNGTYTTANAQRLALSGNGTLYLGDAQIPHTGDGLIRVIKNINNYAATFWGTISNITSSQTTTSTPRVVIASSAAAFIGSDNSQNWTDPSALVGMQGGATIRGAATGTITGATGINSVVNNNSLSAILTNTYVYKGTVGGTGSITNAAGAFLYSLGRASNNTGVYLDIATSQPAIPTGNWGIYDNTGYNNYFAGNMVIGTSTMPAGYKFAVAGDVVAESMTVKLHANWPDYVFRPSYSLISLPELKNYIDKNQHLPDMPSAAEVERDGQNLGEMNKLLLKKIEELTLYLVDKDKQVTELNAKVKTQDDRLSALEKQIEKLSKADNKQ